MGRHYPSLMLFPLRSDSFHQKGRIWLGGKGKHMLRFGWGGNLHIDILGHHVKSEKEDKDQADIDKTCDITMEKLDPFQF